MRFIGTNMKTPVKIKEVHRTMKEAVLRDICNILFGFMRDKDCALTGEVAGKMETIKKSSRRK